MSRDHDSAPRWGTWDNARMTAVGELGSGLGVGMTLWSTAQSDFRDPTVADVTVEARDLRAGTGSMLVHHAGSTLRWAFEQVAVDTVVVRAALLEPGEWALRRWLHLDVGRVVPGAAPTPVRAAVDRDPIGTARPISTATAHADGVGLAVATTAAADRLGVYTAVSELADELHEGGYYQPHVDAVGPAARTGILRFSGQQHPVVEAVVVQDVDVEAALARAAATARQLRSRPGDAQRETQTSGEAAMPTPATLRGIGTAPEAVHGMSRRARATEAIRTVLGVNTIWDPHNQRVQTCATRHWTEPKFGGFGVWLTDTFHAALLAAAIGDGELAVDNLRVATAHATAAGNLPGLANGHEVWEDRSQPPVGALVLRRVDQLLDLPDVVTEVLPVLEANNDWWWNTRRVPGRDLVTYGSSPVGEATFAFTRQAALNESAMDNMPMFDDASFDWDTGLLDIVDPGINALLAVDAECIAALRVARGLEPGPWAERATRLAAAVHDVLWDEQRGLYACWRPATGDFQRAVSPTSFWPLLLADVPAERVSRLVDDHLCNPATFWGPRPVPASPADDPASADDVYWRGRIWPPHLWLVHEGLVRRRLDATADELVDRAWEMFDDAWRDGRCPENYSLDGTTDVGPDVDPLYTWGGLVPHMVLRGDQQVSW